MNKIMSFNEKCAFVLQRPRHNRIFSDECTRADDQTRERDDIERPRQPT